MNSTTYQRGIRSPFHAWAFQKSPQRKPVMAKNERDPLSDTVQECIGSFDVTATFEKDESTLALLKNVEGLVAFICTLKRNGEVISQGRGSAIVNRKSRFIDRAVSTAFGSAFVD